MKASTFLSNLHHAYAQTDGSYAFPNSREGDMIKTAKREIEELRTERDNLVGILRYFGLELVRDQIREGDVILLGPEIEGVTTGVTVRPIPGGKYQKNQAELERLRATAP